MHVGFIHGVMNTDNMAMSGETIDYGPCAFMDIYDPERSSVPSTRGRYAYANQPRIAQWNLAHRWRRRFCRCLQTTRTPRVKEAQAAIGMFFARFETAYATGFGASFICPTPLPVI